MIFPLPGVSPHFLLVFMFAFDIRILPFSLIKV